MLAVDPMSRKSPDERPRIWAEGSQHPPLQPRAFALASVLFAREGLGRLLRRCSVWSHGFSETVASGRWQIPEARLGRIGRVLPTYQQVSRAITAGAALLETAAQTVRPQTATPAEPLLSVPDRTAAAPSGADPLADPDLAAIRALMTAPAEAAADASGVPQEFSVEGGAFTDSPGLPHRIAAAGLGYGLLVLAVPYGAVRAGLAHLNGEDLRKLVEEG
ncbi:hypothetical protein C5F44_07015 [Fuscovulum blasticum DSM 2131]|uniref:Uncharacterized protein n=1 Tax=Fuscovulum blasticum DSM 2131 TaxID=1188250 RepID=A0A2T4JAU3_FUSBL|nr:hypothetical protein C5F44_07015 [Fuscovulum blasticum DSM 2131]